MTRGWQRPRSSMMSKRSFMAEVLGVGGTHATAVLDRERHQCGRRTGVDTNHDLGSFAGAELNPLDRNR